MVAAGVFWETSRRKEVARYAEALTQELLSDIEHLTLAAQAEATLVSLNGGVAVSLPRGHFQPDLVETAVLQRAQSSPQMLTVDRLVHPVQLDPVFHQLGHDVLLPSASLGSWAFYSSIHSAPTHLIFCFEPPGHAFKTCSAVSVRQLLKAAEASAAQNLEVSVQDDSQRVLYRSDDYDLVSHRWRVHTAESPTLHLLFSVKPSDILIARYNPHAGAGLIAAGVVLLVVGSATLTLLQRHRVRQEQLWAELQRSRQARLDLLRQALRVIAEPGGMCFYFVRPDKTVELFGPWAEHSGLHASEVPLQGVASNSTEPDRVVDFANKLLSERSAGSLVFQRVVEGDMRTFQTIAAPVFHDSEYLGHLGLSTDITEALQVQQARAQAIEVHRAQLEVLQRLQLEISGPTLHGLSALDVMRAHLRAGEHREAVRWVSVATQSHDAVSRILREIVAFMDLRSMPPLQELHQVDAVRIIETTIQEHASDAQLRHQRLQLDPKGAHLALSDTTLLSQMLSRLLCNAISYAPGNSTIYVSVRNVPGWCEISIEDEGPGMTDAEIAELGKPLFRGAAARTQQLRGNGLGIAKALQKARRCRARIDFARSKAPGRGLCVTVSLPLPSDFSADGTEVSISGTEVR
jgi:signal transduction histidine kinase